MEKRQGIQVYSAIKIYDGKPVATSQMISEEMPLTIYLNGKELVTMLCSPVEQKYLALGFLVSEGMIACQEDLTQFMLDEERGLIWAEAETVPANAG